MRERGGAVRRLSVAVVSLVCLALAAPAGAMAATVVNGGFESGMQGWGVQSTDAAFGNWFVQQGTKPPFSDDAGKRGTAPVPAPPQGRSAAVSDQLFSSTMFLYQDIALESGAKHQLNLQTYYSSNRPLALPAPETLSTDEAVIGSQANQQYRIDIVRPDAPLDSIAPGDVLRTIFRTMPGDPATMPPTRISSSLSAFAGQTIRLRAAVAAGKEALNAGLDGVSITTTPLAGPGSTGGAAGKGGKGKGGAGARLRILGRAHALGNGTARLRVHVPGAGRLTAKRPKMLVAASATAPRARNLTLRLRPTVRAAHLLERKGRLRLKVALTFVPRGGDPQKATAPVLLKLSSPRRP
jgi:hypothetical protein